MQRGGKLAAHRDGTAAIVPIRSWRLGALMVAATPQHIACEWGNAVGSYDPTAHGVRVGELGI
jgi:hypothetical protein